MLRDDALRIWQAGLAAVKSDTLVQSVVRVEGHTLFVEDLEIDLASVRKIAVVGAGKAGAGMAAGLEQALGTQLLAEKQVTGWLSVPADCVRKLDRIHLHAARPAGVNEPRPEGAAGAAEILKIVESLGPKDLCIALVSGGASALLPAPVDSVPLTEKLAVTRHLSGAGANIEQLNTVRKQLSRIKGGGLARACRAGRLVTLIISDVLGDPLDIIASGPTVPDPGTPQAALAVLHKFGVVQAGIAPAAVAYLCNKGSQPAPPIQSQVDTLVIGNNAVAVDAAGAEAERLGYEHAMISARTSEGPAEDIGRHLAEMAVKMRAGEGPNVLISGGEPVVQLVDANERGLGGRNQQLILAALIALAAGDPAGIAIVSAGTDGEDGPTDAAGALVDAELIRAMRQQNLDPADFLRRNDAYHFFEKLGGLVKTGPTHTNVCDVRVVLVERTNTHGRLTSARSLL